MFKKIILYSFVCTSISLFAQSEETWTSSFDNEINWQTVSALGNYIVHTNSGLYGIDNNTGEVIWSDLTFSRLSEDSFTELDNSPFAKIETEKGFFIVNLFDGSKVFNSFDHGIKNVKQHFVLYQSNAIVVAGKSVSGEDMALSIDISTGNVLWSKEGSFGKLINLVELNDEELLGITLLKNVKIKSKTGDVIWSVDNSSEAEQISKMGAFGNLLKNVAEAASEGMEIKLDFNMHPSRKYFIIGSEQRNENQSMSSNNGNTIVTFTSTYSAYDISNGQMIWEKPIEVKGQLGLTTWINNNLLVLPQGASNSRVNLFSMEDGNGLWGKKGRGITIKGGIYDYTPTEEGMLVITTRNEKHFLNYLDTKNGLFTFDKTIKVKGHVGYTLTTDNGILYATAEEMNIVNTITGDLLWDKDLKTHYKLVNQNGNHLYTYDYKSGAVVSVNLDSGAIDMAATEPVRFSENESPNTLELRKKGILLSSDQNFAMYDYNGTLLFQKYYASPREEGWKRALLFAGTIYAGYVSAVSTMTSGALQQAGAQYGLDTVEGQTFAELGAAYNEMGRSAGSAAGLAFNAANKRFKATKEARNYCMVLTKGENGIELLKINKDTGENESSIPLGKNRKPNYAIDLVEGEVFLKHDSKMVKRFIL
ncbi:PQQ-binding-like beta-propeller repeat protein [Eudoraea adriatica]|uniref:PQQ-binding-like beta-propeller repeat protein n=1 Tax=Eudoraea adriatica TaxID=446681 RepID=UPI00035E4435|nr:PQQ-binding-like beta-propeller repeat protein [Eudoraea adriatica]